MGIIQRHTTLKSHFPTKSGHPTISGLSMPGIPYFLNHFLPRTKFNSCPIDIKYFNSQPHSKVTSRLYYFPGTNLVVHLSFT